MDFKTVIGAATGASALALKLSGINTSILHAELAGLVTALILSNQAQDAQNGRITLLTDHLNSVRFIHDNQSSINQEPRL
jgi:hypothetical protein